MSYVMSKCTAVSRVEQNNFRKLKQSWRINTEGIEKIATKATLFVFSAKNQMNKTKFKIRKEYMAARNNLNGLIGLGATCV